MRFDPNSEEKITKVVRTHRLSCISVESSIHRLLKSVKTFGRHPVVGTQVRAELVVLN